MKIDLSLPVGINIWAIYQNNITQINFAISYNLIT